VDKKCWWNHTGRAASVGPEKKVFVDPVSTGDQGAPRGIDPPVNPRVRSTPLMTTTGVRCTGTRVTDRQVPALPKHTGDHVG